MFIICLGKRKISFGSASGEFIKLLHPYYSEDCPKKYKQKIKESIIYNGHKIG